MIRKYRDGTTVEICDSQEKTLGFLYETAFGRVLLKILVRPWVSKMGGKVLSTRISCIAIRPFVRRSGICMSEYETETYRSYNDFFTRRIRPQCRPIDRDPMHLISPCDSKLTVYRITPDGVFTIKHTQYTVSSLLKNETLAQSYYGGICLVFRLAVDDYHRYCYVADGEKGDNVTIDGVFHTVNPIANDRFPIYKENTREYSLLQTERFGPILMMEVGALMVGKIVNHHGSARVSRGEEKGYFQFGGSTIVLLFRDGTVKIDPDILENSRNGIETVVKIGEKIGNSI